MNYKIIPNKNKIFENEKFYLENKYKNGLKLEKKGIIFYKFTNVDPKEVTYEIDLLPKNVSIEYLGLENWDIITTEKISYKNLLKVYYLNQEPTERLLVDNIVRLEYYNHKKTSFLTIAGVSSFPVLLTYVLAAALVPIPTVILYTLLPLICLSIYTLKHGIIFSKGADALNIKLGNIDKSSFNAHYIIKFENLTSQELNVIDEKLSNLGTIRKVNDNIYRIETSLSEKYLLQEISGLTEIKEDNISVTRIGNLYFMV